MSLKHLLYMTWREVAYVSCMWRWNELSVRWTVIIASSGFVRRNMSTCRNFPTWTAPVHASFHTRKHNIIQELHVLTKLDFSLSEVQNVDPYDCHGFLTSALTLEDIKAGHSKLNVYKVEWCDSEDLFYLGSFKSPSRTVNLPNRDICAKFKSNLIQASRERPTLGLLQAKHDAFLVTTASRKGSRSSVVDLYSRQLESLLGLIVCNLDSWRKSSQNGTRWQGQVSPFLQHELIVVYTDSSFSIFLLMTTNVLRCLEQLRLLSDLSLSPTTWERVARNCTSEVHWKVLLANRRPGSSIPEDFVFEREHSCHISQ